jgi:hypothetical protein
VLKNSVPADLGFSWLMSLSFMYKEQEDEQVAEGRLKSHTSMT